MTKNKLESCIYIRVTPKMRALFLKKAEKFGTQSDVLREIIEAFVEDRLTIKPNPRKESLYVSGK